MAESSSIISSSNNNSRKMKLAYNHTWLTYDPIDIFEYSYIPTVISYHKSICRIISLTLPFGATIPRFWHPYSRVQKLVHV